jgi:hypothetical protein
MEKFKDQPIWEGMDFKTLALAMSSKSEDFGTYLRRMNVPGEWIDAAALQAIACSFKVDLLVWQLNQEPALLGYSGTPGMTQPLGTFCIAMVNDLHYWGVIPKEETACTFCIPQMPVTLCVLLILHLRGRTKAVMASARKEATMRSTLKLKNRETYLTRTTLLW